MLLSFTPSISCGYFFLSPDDIPRATPSEAAPNTLENGSNVLRRIKLDGNIRLGMYLGFEGLSFRERGRLVGLEVEIAELLCETLSQELEVPINPQIVNQEWSQIIKVLRDEKYDAVLSAVIPSSLYDRYRVRYSIPYLQTGPTICCKEVSGKPSLNLTADISTLENKRIVIINDPAARQLLRQNGIYVDADKEEPNLERSFPQSATESAMRNHGVQRPLIPVREIVQIDEMSQIYEMIASGNVDAGVIDMGIIWWVSTKSRRWADKIYAFDQPVGPYVYSVTTREEDVDLGDVLDRAIKKMLADPRYSEIYQRWHGPTFVKWNLNPADFLRPELGNDSSDRNFDSGAVR